MISVEAWTTIRYLKAQGLGTRRIPIGGTGRPYGYTCVMGKGKHEGKRYVNEDEAKWVREMYLWLVDVIQ